MFDVNCFIILILKFNTSGYLQSNFVKGKDVLVYVTKLYVRVGVVLKLSYPRHYMDVGSHFHASAAFPPRKGLPFPIENESLCVPGSF